jgi:S-sulfosulfanyl-L-cysteine sulfohydrolase
LSPIFYFQFYLKSKPGTFQIWIRHAYFDLHQEMFWRDDHAIYRPAGGYARIAAIVKQIRAESRERMLFCDCGDTMHGTYPALGTLGQALIPVLNSLGLDAMTAHWEFAYGPKVFNQRVAELNYPMLASNVYYKKQISWYISHIS